MNSKILFCGTEYGLWHRSCSYSGETDKQSLAKNIWNFGMKKKSEKRVSRKDAKARRVVISTEGRNLS